MNVKSQILAVIVGAIAFSLTITVATLAARNPYTGKKLIEYGGDVPDTEYVRQHAGEMEKVPFNGVVISVHSKIKGGAIGWYMFSRNRFAPEEYEHAIPDLKATKFKRFTDNFIQTLASPGDLDWFDPQWASVAYNGACLARVAKQGGCKGIMFDPEDYGSGIWNYNAWSEERRAAHTFNDYRAKVRQRGREFIRAVNKEYPDITILSLVGPSLSYCDYESVGGLKSGGRYGLLSSFFDGICEAATPGTIIVDGYEQSYAFREQRFFWDGRERILRLTKKTISLNPKAYAKHIRVGFGVWADCQSGELGWHPEDFSKNYYTPAGFRASLAYALEASDKHVWVYTERFHWWPLNAPSAYVKALALARTGPGPGQKEGPWAVKAADIPGYPDEKIFADMRKTMTEVFDLPKEGWRFNRDERNSGQQLGWYKEDFDDSAWRTISIGKFWEEQGEYYDGRAWYRRKFISPPLVNGKRMFLGFGAVDESAWVRLNGRFIGAHDLGPLGWDIPFVLEVTHALRNNAENTLAVQVYDRAMAGGIWKSVKLLVK